MTVAQFSAEFRERSCTSKTRYATQVIAEGEAVRIWRKDRHAMKTYHCQFCDGWHLATSSISREVWQPSRAEKREWARNARQRQRRVHGRRR